MQPSPTPQEVVENQPQIHLHADFQSVSQMPGSSAVQVSARAWLELRSKVQAYPTQVRLLWGIAAPAFWTACVAVPPDPGESSTTPLPRRSAIDRPRFLGSVRRVGSGGSSSHGGIQQSHLADRSRASVLKADRRSMDGVGAASLERDRPAHGEEAQAVKETSRSQRRPERERQREERRWEKCLPDGGGIQQLNQLPADALGATCSSSPLSLTSTFKADRLHFTFEAVGVEDSCKVRPSPSRPTGTTSRLSRCRSLSPTPFLPSSTRLRSQSLLRSPSCLRRPLFGTPSTFLPSSTCLKSQSPLTRSMSHNCTTFGTPSSLLSRSMWMPPLSSELEPWLDDHAKSGTPSTSLPSSSQPLQESSFEKTSSLTATSRECKERMASSTRQVNTAAAAPCQNVESEDRKVPGAAASTVEVEALWRSMTRWLLTGPRCALRSFFHSSFQCKANKLKQTWNVGHVWPMPLPYPTLGRRHNSGKPHATKQALNAMILVLNWLSLNQPVRAPADYVIDAPLNSEQKKVIVRLTRLMQDWIDCPAISAADMGRSAGKVETVEMMLQQLTVEAMKVSREQGSGKTVAPSGASTSMLSEVQVAKEIEAHRLKFGGRPQFNPMPFLDPETAEMYDKPLTNSTPPWDSTETPPKVQVRGSRSEILALLKALDETDGLGLFPEQMVRMEHRAGLFSLMKNLTTDRLILDSRPANIRGRLHFMDTIHGINPPSLSIALAARRGIASGWRRSPGLLLLLCGVTGEVVSQFFGHHLDQAGGLTIQGLSQAQRQVL